MDRLKHYYHSTKKYFIDKPKMLIPAGFLAFLLLIVVFETTRASFYNKSVDSYKSSVTIQEVKDAADKLNKVSHEVAPSIFCVIDQNDLFKGVNIAYASLSEEKQPKTLLNKINNNLSKAGDPPSFNSLVQFMPNIRKARQNSNDINAAVSELRLLIMQDERSEYCLQLERILSEVYFLPDIDSPEGVSALLVGQLEEFQVSVSKTQKDLRALIPPENFSQLHVDLAELLNSVAKNLREEDNNYNEFSRRIELNVITLNEILGDISIEAEDLVARPSKIAIQADILN